MLEQGPSWQDKGSQGLAKHSTGRGIKRRLMRHGSLVRVSHTTYSPSCFTKQGSRGVVVCAGRVEHGKGRGCGGELPKVYLI